MTTTATTATTATIAAKLFSRYADAYRRSRSAGQPAVTVELAKAEIEILWEIADEQGVLDTFTQQVREFQGILRRSHNRNR